MTDSRSDAPHDELPGMLAVAKGVAEQTWPHTMDAAVWAAEFVKRYPGFDEGEAIGWFANAIMAGYDTAQQRAARSETGPKLVIVHDNDGSIANVQVDGKVYLPEPAVPCVAVPREPTREMLTALMGNPVLLAASDEIVGRAAYAAMLDAAPKVLSPERNDG